MSATVDRVPSIVCDRCGVSRHPINVLVLLAEAVCVYCLAAPFDASRAASLEHPVAEPADAACGMCAGAARVSVRCGGARPCWSCLETGLTHAVLVAGAGSSARWDRHAGARANCRDGACRRRPT